jgi:hypothetical protein
MQRKKLELMDVLASELVFFCMDDISRIADAVLNQRAAVIPILQEVEDGQGRRGKEGSDTPGRGRDENQRVE